MKGDNNMTDRIFTIEEMENIFEIGRSIQAAVENERIEVEDSKEVFLFALNLALEFKREFPEPYDYYAELEEFIVDKITEAYGVEN